MILDFDLDFLRAAAALQDSSLDRLQAEPRSSPDPDAFGIFDEIEYLAGFGFVACQTYATAVVSQSQLKGNKREALARGPKHRTGRSMAQLVNAAANHWKHSPEWALDAPTTQAKQTIEVISSLGVDTNDSYPVANMLREILTPHKPRFENLIPFLTEWRDALLV
ncbi:MAG: hypothetical protein ACKVQU_01300 [Burkholderiales bacterium]